MSRDTCPRCAQTDEQRRRDHKTKHNQGCTAGRGGVRRALQSLAVTSAVPTLPAVQPLSPGAVSGRRITQQVREGLLAVFEALGGEVALLTWAKENPSQFFGMWSKAVPRESESANRAQGITVVVSSAAEIARRPVIEAEVVDVTPRLDVEEELV